MLILTNLFSIIIINTDFILIDIYLNLVSTREWKREAISIPTQGCTEFFALAPSLVVLHYISIHIRDIALLLDKYNTAPFARPFLV